VSDYPVAITPVNHVAPVPRRIRAVLAGVTVLDTTQARYVWEWPYYPQYYVPLTDVRPGVLESEGDTEETSRGPAEVHALRVGERHRPHAATVLRTSDVAGLAGTVRFEWAALDAWYEEDEEVFVHPRNPYARIDAVRSTRRVRIEVDGVCVAESSSPVMVFETGLPTRYYLNPTEVDFAHLVPSDTVTECPYKGTTSHYWSIDVGGRLRPDLVWSYDFPARQLLPVAGMLCFYNEKVDIFVDGHLRERPETPFSA
jgi:uncharacterized protein (DUF427 family)